jgi:hypothetical protein
VNTVLSDLGPLALIINLVSYKSGLNGAGRDFQHLIGSIGRRRRESTSRSRNLTPATTQP